MHFFNPAPVMKLVEVIRTVVTDQEVVDDVEALAVRFGKVDVTVGDRAGFIANALLFGYLNHAVTMYESRYATREDIDAAMKLGCGLPMGPLALMDLIGLDTAYEILDTMYKQGRDRLHAPEADHQADGHRGAAGPEVRPRLLHLRQARLTERRARRADAGRRAAEDAALGAAASASSAPAPWRPASSRCSPRPATTWSTSPARRRRAGRCAPSSRSLEKAVVRGKLSEADRDATLSRVTDHPLDDLAPVDLVVEAVVEEFAVKQALFANFDEICKPGTVLATTTSSLPVVECAAATSRPADVVGLHFFNPAPVMKLVEIVRTVSTAAEVVATAREVCERLGKHPVTCATGPASSSTPCCSRT